MDSRPASEAAGSERPMFWLVDPNLIDFVGHQYEYDRAVVDGASAEGFEVRVLAHRAVIDPIAATLPLDPVFDHNIWTSPPGDGGHDAGERRANQAFYDALSATIAQGRLDHRSVIFGHMLTSRQLLGWARFASEHLGPNGPAIILLLRYQPELYQGAASDEGFRLLQTAAARGRLRLSSDSARLAHQLERLTTLPVEVWPLPHTTDLRPGPPRDPSRPLRVVSLGNARDEKGVLELFNAVRILDALGMASGFSFALQVNDPVEALKPAIAAFAAERRTNVELIWDPLSSAGYIALLNSADIVAVPYWREIYEARTSGIFMEALAAGKPVVCTDDTWMSDQLTLAGAGVTVPNRNDSGLAAGLLRVAADYVAMEAQARATAGRWLDIHNPQSFMRALLHGEQAPTAAANRPTAAILYPWGDAEQNAAGASVRINLLAKFLAEAAKVRVLGDGDHATIRRDRIVFEAVPMMAELQAMPAYWWASRFARHILRARDGEEIYFLLLLMARFSRTLRARIDEIVRNSDFVFLDYPFWAPLVDAACRAHNKRYVLTAHDVIADQVRFSRPLRWLTAWLERRAMALATHRVAVSTADVRKFARWGLTTELSQNGVDIEAAAQRLPVDTRPLLSALTGLPGGGPLFIFIGSKFRPNLLAAARVMEIARALRARSPELGATVVVVGGCMEAKREPGFASLGRVDGLTLRLLYEHCSGVVIPLTEGTGLSLKTVEALAGGHVVVGSDVAFRGLPQYGEPAWIVENDLDRYPEHLSRLVQDPTWSRTVKEAVALYRPNLDFRASTGPYLRVFPELDTGDREIATPESQYRDDLMSASSAAADAGLEPLASALRAHAATSGSDLENDNLLRAQLNGGNSLKPSNPGIVAALNRGADAVPLLQAMAPALCATAGDRTLAQAAAIEAHRAWTIAGDLALRSRLWARFHAGDESWVHRVAAIADRLQPDLPACDYAYLRARTSHDENLIALDEAIERARVAVDRGFDLYWGSMLYGELLDRAGRDEEAIAAYARAAYSTHDPGMIDMAETGAARASYVAFSQPDTTRARDLARAGIAIWPSNGHLNFILAETLKKRGEDLLLCCEAYRRAAPRYHLASRARMGLAEVLGWIGEPEAAAPQRAAAIECARDEEERRIMTMRAAAPALIPVN